MEQDKKQLRNLINIAAIAAHIAGGNYAGAAVHGAKYIKTILTIVFSIILVMILMIVIIISCLTMSLNNTDSTVADGTFLWPIQGMNTYISSPFGDRINPVTHKASHHDGIDIAGANINLRPIYAAADGTVEKLVTNDRWYGNYVLLDHANNVKTFYGHCSGFAVIKVGDNVNTGEIIAYVGSTGNSTGPHLHFGVLVNNKYVDPTQYNFSGIKCSNFSQYHKSN